ncbi:MAG: porin [Rhodospirillales bacterium]|nr:porin [Rhodospirillales bacterium]MDE0710896.1 porin [Rhodospirillales bacterium]
MLLRLLTYAYAIAFVVGMGTQAFAQESGSAETDARIQALELRVQQLEKALAEALGIETAEPPPPAEDATTVAQAEPAPNGNNRSDITGQQGAYNYDKAFFGPIAPLSSSDGRFKTFLYGNLQTDLAAYSESGDWEGVFGDDYYIGKGDTDFSGGAKMRRASFGIANVVEQDWIVFMSYNLADGGEQVDSGLRAAAIVYRGIKPWWLMAGQFGNSVGLESSTFNSFLGMAERPMMSNAFAYAPSAPVMALIASHRGKLTYSRFGVFGKNSGVDSDFDEGWGLHGRFLLQPHRERRLSSHIGVSGYWRKPEEEVVGADHMRSCPEGSMGSGFRFRAFGISAVDGTSLVNTGKFCAVEDYTYVVAEGALSRGPVSLQGEWGTAQVNTKSSGSYEFSGGYVDVGYFLTGESRNYNPYFGQFWRLKPDNDLGQGGLGAFELRARWQMIDLNDRLAVVDGNVTGVTGGEASGFTVGLNWYFNAFTRAIFNAGRIDVEYPTAVGGRLGTREASVDEYVARVEIFF